MFLEEIIKMKKNTKSLLFIILAVVALMGVLALVRQSQETRRGAYFAGTSLRVGSPGQAFLVNSVGEDILVPVFVETEQVAGTSEMAKVDFAKVTLCYGDHLNLVEDADGYVDYLVDFNHDAFDVLLFTKVENNCLTFTVKSEKSADRLKSGMFRVATVTFNTIAQGSGSINIDRDKTQVSGSNPNLGSNDMALSLGDLVGADYSVGGGGGPTNTPVVINPTNTPAVPVDVSPTLRPTSTSRPTSTQRPTSTLRPTSTSRPTVPTSKPTDKPVVPTSKPTDKPVVPTDKPIGGDTPVLNFRIAFAGVKTNHAYCVVAWPVGVIVMKGEIKKSYADVIVENTGEVNSKGEIVFVGSLELTGFYETEGVAAFIKGPKHLQMKYAMENQSGSYGKVGGELNLTYSSKIYDFSEYSLLAGDVNRDGWINGLDFSQVKSAAVQYIEVETGGYIIEDLDGSCQVNTADTTLLVKSLDERQEELY